MKGTFSLYQDGMAELASEQNHLTGDEYYDEDRGGSCRYESDFAYFKPRADLLLVGNCHIPDNKPIQACQVTFQVGKRAKSLAIFGNRFWEGLMGGGAVPEFFTEMPLKYEHSFGGNRYKKKSCGERISKRTR